MIFTSFLFLFVFLPLVLAAYFAVPSLWRKGVLIVGSLVFYSAWRLDFVALLVGMTVFSYGISALLHRHRHGPWRWRVLVAGVAGNVACLGYFKYANFGIAQLDALALMLGFRAVSAGWEAVVLPLGISFFTFHAVSYVVDTYRGGIKELPPFPDFLLYMVLFPHLIAGPIVRFTEISEQIADLRVKRSEFDRGVILFIIGFCKKVLIADNLAPVASAAFSASTPTFCGSWLGTAAYSFQLYFDFSGYSDMAIGLAAMLGIHFPTNFNSPYKSRSISEFWTRWHMTLSRFLRDYIYIPMGGNRAGAVATYRNLLITMLIAGFWHGAAWTFVAWGAWHGILLALERANGRRPIYAGAHPAVAVPLTWILVTLGWVLFNSASLAEAARMYAAMFNPASSCSMTGFPLDLVFAITLAISLVLGFAAPNSQTLAQTKHRALPILLLLAFLVAVHELFFHSLTPFLYFQF